MRTKSAYERINNLRSKIYSKLRKNVEATETTRTQKLHTLVKKVEKKC